MARRKNTRKSSVSRDASRQLVDEVLRRNDIVQVAKHLGLELSGENTNTPRSLCPFHPDQRPSLHLFRDDSPNGRDHFHCFVCGAHGDAITLSKEIKGWDFQSTLGWLASLAGIDLGSTSLTLIAPSGREVGFRAAEQIYALESPSESDQVDQWAASRLLPRSIVTEAGIRAPSPNRLSATVANDRELIEGLLDAGLLVPQSLSDDSSSQMRLLSQDDVRDFYRSPRVLFPLKDESGETVGFAGRALIETDTPKYLFTRGFKRSAILYRLDAVRRRLKLDARRKPRSDKHTLVHVYIVEGLVDALRLESLGLNAVAILGSTIASDQVACLDRLAKDIERAGGLLVAHIFLDADDAGRRGTIQAIGKLLPVAASDHLFLISVVAPNTDDLEVGHDPDELFLHIDDVSEAERKLKTWSYSVVDAMIAASWNTPLPELAERWKLRTYAQEVMAFRDAEGQFDSELWTRILDRVRPTQLWFDEDAESLKPWAAGFERFVRATPEPPTIAQKADRIGVAPPGVEEQIQRAVQLAYSSTQRRELPVDEGSWTRIQIAIDAFVPYFRASLALGARPAEPFIAIKVPKPDGTFRLKALPAPEELVVQQYMLVELLRDYRDGRGFLESIPAVRYTRRKDASSLTTTGLPHLRPSRTVSFAYQIDMDVVEGLLPPRREGIFRPYYPCWMEFIQFLDNATAEIEAPRLHVARLDIRHYYDALRRTAVNDVLYQSLETALRHLRFADQDGILSCAGAFKRDATSTQLRAQRIVDWLCDQSFGYEYLSPEDGKTISSASEQGVPQGPDLSAYLANIALFPLDYRVDTTSIELGTVYARYVDDIVIAAPTANALREVRAVIEDELSRIGLELNDKSRQFDPMSRDAFRTWLTDRRGGLGVSGPFAGPPLIEPILTDDPWAVEDIPDRDEALRLLHDTDLLCAATTIVETVVRGARRADDLRHNDLVKAMLLLWRCIGTASHGEPSLNIAKQFVDLALSTEPRDRGRHGDDEAALNRDARTLFVWLDGLELFLRAKSDRFRELTAQDQEVFRNSQKVLADFVCQGQLVEKLEEHLQPAIAIATQFRHLLVLKSLQTLAAAVTVSLGKCKPTLQNLGLHSSDLDSTAVKRLILSIAELTDSTELLATATQHVTHESRLLFHESICRLRIANDSQKSPSDPLSEINSRVVQRLRMPVSSEDSVLVQILAYWMPGDVESGTIDSSLAERALDAFINVAKANALELMHNRPHFAEKVLENGKEAIRLIPAPPGIRVPGLLGVKAEEVVRRRDLHEMTGTLLPTDLDWTVVNGAPVKQQHNRLLEASLGDRRLVVPLDYGEGFESQKPPLSRIEQVRWLAVSFSELSQRVASSDSCPATPFNLLASVIAAGPNQLLGYSIADSNDLSVENLQAVGRHSAFVRAGRCSLSRIEVPQFYGPLWQVGTALAEVLGMSHVTKSLEIEPVELDPSVVGLTVEQLAEKLLRVALYRLRGSWDPVSFVAQDSNGWPKTVARAVECLLRFPQLRTTAQRNEAMASFLRLFAEGKALQLRCGPTQRRLSETNPGSATAFLADFSQGLFSVDAQLAATLPTCSPPHGVRRSVGAWLSVAKRLTTLQEGLPDKTNSDCSLTALIAGCCISAVSQHARSVVLELWSHLSEKSIEENIESSWDNMLLWVDEQWEFVNWRFIERFDEPNGSSSDVPGPDPNTLGTGQSPHVPTSRSTMPQNLRRTLRLLKRATATSSTRYWRDLQRITPLGWLVLLEFTLHAWSSEFDIDNDAPKTKAVLKELRDVCAIIAVPLAQEERDEADVPWGGLEQAIDLCDLTFAEAAIKVLRDIDEIVSISVVQFESPNLLMGQPRAERIEVRTDEGTFHLRSSQISVSQLQRERNRHGAEYFYRKDNPQPYFVWTESRRKGTLIGVHLVRPGLAEWAGFRSPTLDNVRAIRAGEVLSEGLQTPQLSGIGEPSRTDAPHVTPEPHVPQAHPMLAAVAGGTSVKDALRALEKLQNSAWERRRIRPGSHIRVAIAQWNVDDSYRHPIVDACFRNESELSNIAPHEWTGNLVRGMRSELRSCNEFRRQKILESVLRACGRFDVDALLLPEYSVRPETVGWIRAALPRLAPDTWVWAGTFRKPPYLSGISPLTGDLHHAYASALPWSAIHAIVDPRQDAGVEERRRYLIRRKKYPAIGMGELFAPFNQELEPVYQDTEKPDDPRRRIMELICSEIFIVTSPANLNAAAYAYRELAARFGVLPSPKKDWRSELRRIVKESISKDLISIGDATSVITSLRRSIIFVPAMTSRAEDYAVLGQAGYLASGLTTVFCNAVDIPFGSGRSCFIGHDGWGKREDPLPAFPVSGPYHGVRPGIFDPLDATDRGCLGKEEQAVVIADIDTQFPSEGKPRPQMLPAPLRLVAHLPILETWDYVKNSEPVAEWTNCRCLRIKKSDWHLTKSQSNPQEWVQFLCDNLRNPPGAMDPTQGLLTTVNHPNLSGIAEAVARLARAFSKSKWMEKRAQQFVREHAANPQSWPPPVAVDWLVVDLGEVNKNRWPKIEVPAYSQLSGDIR